MSAAAALLHRQPSDAVERLERELERQRGRFQALLIDYENAQVDLAVKRREIGALKAKVSRLETPEDPVNAKLAQHAQVVFDYWNARCKSGRAREFTEERRKAVLARLAARPVADIFIAIDGASAFPFIDKSGKKHNELELICRNGSKFDSFYERGERYWEQENTRIAEQLDRFNAKHRLPLDNNLFGPPPGVQLVDCWGCKTSFDGSTRPAGRPYCSATCQAEHNSRPQLRLVEAA